MNKLRFIGLNVHADTIAVAVAETGGEVRSIGTIPNRLESIRKMIGKLGPAKELRAGYQAGPTGYALLAAHHAGRGLPGCGPHAGSHQVRRSGEDGPP